MLSRRRKESTVIAHPVEINVFFIQDPSFQRRDQRKNFKEIYFCKKKMELGDEKKKNIKNIERQKKRGNIMMQKEKI